MGHGGEDDSGEKRLDRDYEYKAAGDERREAFNKTRIDVINEHRYKETERHKRQHNGNRVKESERLVVLEQPDDRIDDLHSVGVGRKL